MSQRNVFYYDQASNISCVCDPDDGLTYYEYDLLNRTTAVKNPFGEVTYYEYTPGGQVKTKVHGNGAISYYSYDAAQRVSDIKHVKSDLTELATLDYDYDAVGNPTQVTREDSSATYYSYDAIYQLAAETQLDSGGQTEFAAEYDYDAAHNRTVKVVDGTATYYSYNAANELLTEATGAETTYYHYDGSGNTVSKQETAGTTYYAYDTENLLTRIDFAAGGHNYYTYDADSKRVSQQTADGFREFIYQGPDMLALQMERDESETTVAQYTVGDGLEAMRRSGTSSFYHYNHLGTTLALTGTNEAVTDTYQHDAWGILLGSTGATVNPHTYVGQQRYYRMPTADLYHLGFRDYAQGLGRFTTVDPMLRLYRPFIYSANRPTTTIDADGLVAWIVVGGIVVGIVIIGVITWLCIRDELRCAAGGRAAEKHVPNFINRDYKIDPLWPQGAATSVSDEIMHCVYHCYVASHWGDKASKFCEKWRNEDQHEIGYNKIGRQAAKHGYHSIEDCYNYCLHYVFPVEEPGTGVGYWPGNKRPHLPPPGGSIAIISGGMHE